MEYRFSESEESSKTLNSIEPSIYSVYLMSEEEKKEESTPESGDEEDKEMDEPVEETVEKEEEAPAKVDPE